MIDHYKQPFAVAADTAREEEKKEPPQVSAEVPYV
jgi:hypothetical protein